MQECIQILDVLASTKGLRARALHCGLSAVRKNVNSEATLPPEETDLWQDLHAQDRFAKQLRLLIGYFLTLVFSSLSASAPILSAS